MDWNGVVDGGLYSILLKSFGNSVATLASDNEQVIHGNLLRILFGRERDSFYAFELSPIEAGDSPSEAIPIVEPFQLDPADRSVNSVKLELISTTDLFVFYGPSQSLKL